MTEQPAQRRRPTREPRYSTEVIAKAERLWEDGKVERDGDTNVWHVESSKDYRVQTDFDQEKFTLTWITCTCPHGLRKGAGLASCSHAVAVMLSLIEEHHESRAARLEKLFNPEGGEDDG